ncbi:ATPase SWSAP1 [Limanda limanda]|uniref:ATPase SWSAP1 n=1 Tax=Limanda limanda TaxID=27771 RepID=UPI0029C81BA1|nr:ATPase SWSAP1 [Limanda limanda]
MTDILNLVFRTFASPSELRAAPPAAAPRCSALLLGENSLGRSVLLLAAVTAASHPGLRVVFFTRTLIRSLPASLQKLVPSPESLKKIRFCYPRTVEELLQQVAALHEPPHTSPPSLIIVDGLEGFLLGSTGGSHRELHPGGQSCAAHLSALLCDTAAFLSRLLEQRSSGSGPCRVIASFQSVVDAGPASREPSASDPILDILDRYFHVRCTLDPDAGYEAAAAGLQQVWHVYLSGRGITEASSSKDCGDGTAVAREWKLLLFPNGLMEFKVV